MKLNQLRDVLAVAKRGSLRAAARELGLAQPALTRSIRELEHELGVALFERRARGVSVTPAGEHFLRRANAIRAELQRARDEIAQLRGDAQGRLAVCLSSVPHIALLPYALRPFRERYPGVHLDIVEGVYPDAEPALKDGSLDCYIGPPPDSLPAELVADKLFDNARAIVARRGHPLGEVRSLRDLAQAQWATTSLTYRAEQELAPLFARHGLPVPRVVLQARSAVTFMIAVAYSDLLAMLPLQWTEFPLTREALQRIDVVEAIPGLPICILRRAGLPLTPAAEYFCDMVRRASGHVPSRYISWPPRATP